MGGLMPRIIRLYNNSRKGISAGRSKPGMKSLRLGLSRVYPLQPCKTVDHLQEASFPQHSMHGFCQGLESLLLYTVSDQAISFWEPLESLFGLSASLPAPYWAETSKYLSVTVSLCTPLFPAQITSLSW